MYALKKNIDGKILIRSAKTSYISVSYVRAHVLGIWIKESGYCAETSENLL